jgi:hypothetical protein
LTSVAISYRALLGSPWREVRKIYRRVCVLRSQGRDEEAQRVQDTDFARALVLAKETAPDGLETDAQWQAMLAGEEDRVADAVALAELLAPMLRERLPSLTASPSAAVPPARLPSGRPRDLAPSVADFIEEMLTQERALPQPHS